MTLVKLLFILSNSYKILLYYWQQSWEQKAKFSYTQDSTDKSLTNLCLKKKSKKTKILLYNH